MSEWYSPVITVQDDGTMLIEDTGGRLVYVLAEACGAHNDELGAVCGLVAKHIGPHLAMAPELQRQQPLPLAVQVNIFAKEYWA